MGRNVLCPVLLGCAVAAVSGCYESPDVTLYEPGVYKGRTDPLLAKERSPEQQQALRARFELGQTDR
jgi:hypothetical protein